MRIPDSAARLWFDGKYVRLQQGEKGYKFSPLCEGLVQKIAEIITTPLAQPTPRAQALADYSHIAVKYFRNRPGITGKEEELLTLACKKAGLL